LKFLFYQFKFAEIDVGQVVYRHAKKIFSLGCEFQYAFKNRPLKHPIRIQIGIADLLSKMEVGCLEGVVEKYFAGAMD
jgi:hypothetical protein